MLLASCDVCSPHYYESLPLWMELKFSFFTSCFNFLVIVSHVLLDVYLLLLCLFLNCVQLYLVTCYHFPDWPHVRKCASFCLLACYLPLVIVNLSALHGLFWIFAAAFHWQHVFSFFVYIKRCTNVLSVSKLLQNHTCETGFFHDRIILCARFLFLFYYNML